MQLNDIEFMKCDNLNEDDNKENKEKFREFIKDKRKVYAESTGKKMSIPVLAKSLDMSEHMLIKKLNQTKRTNKRDFIIAVGVVLRLVSGEIDEALRLYDMPMLNEKDDRDRFITNKIDGSFDKDTHLPTLTLEQLNRFLKLENFKELDIQKKRTANDGSESEILSYHILGRRVRVPIDELYYKENYDSLGTKYSPIDIHFCGELFLDDIKNKRVIVLSASTSGSLSWPKE